MCKPKPGKRCRGHAQEAVVRNSEVHANTEPGSEEEKRAYAKLQDSVMDYLGGFTTEAGRRHLGQQEGVDEKWVDIACREEEKLAEYRTESLAYLQGEGANMSKDEKEAFIDKVEQEVASQRAKNLKALDYAVGDGDDEARRSSVTQLGRKLVEDERLFRESAARGDEIAQRQAAAEQRRFQRKMMRGGAPANYQDPHVLRDEARDRIEFAGNPDDVEQGAAHMIDALDSADRERLSRRTGLPAGVIEEIRSTKLDVGEPDDAHRAKVSSIREKHPLAYDAIKSDVKHVDAGAHNAHTQETKPYLTPAIQTAFNSHDIKMQQGQHTNPNSGKEYYVVRYEGNSKLAKSLGYGSGTLSGDMNTYTPDTTPTSASVITDNENRNGKTTVFVNTSDKQSFVQNFETRSAADLWIKESMIKADQRQADKSAD